jgi:hypothetical protein
MYHLSIKLGENKGCNDKSQTLCSVFVDVHKMSKKKIKFPVLN